MDQERQRIQDDLRGQLSGDVRCDDLFLQLYASDASIYEIRPLAVVRPRNTADVIACVQYAAEEQIPLFPRGAGTGLAGESLGAGIVLDFSRYMNRIGLVTEETVRVQPGVVHAHLNHLLSRSGRVFGPDPATSAVTTMGSMIAIDAGGSHWLKYGSTRHHIRSVQAVLADGSLVELSNEPRARLDDPQPRRRHLVESVAKLLERDADVIRTFQPDSRVNRSGYGLTNVLTPTHLDMARLMAGSEGTLALITEATLATSQLPAHRGVVLLMFDRLEKAAKAVMDVLSVGPSACDLMDRRHVSLARDNDVRYDLIIPPETEALLLVEVDGSDPQQVRDKLKQAVDLVRDNHGDMIASTIAQDDEDLRLYWQLAQKVVPTLHRLKGSTRPLPFVEDMAVPPEQLPEFLTCTLSVLRRHQVTASLFGHAGHGQMHVRPFLDLADHGDVERMTRLADDLYTEVLRLGGTISGEHGDGLSRTPFLEKQYGPLCVTFQSLKDIFDPNAILNPGKKVGSPGEQAATQHLRPVSLAPRSERSSPDAGPHEPSQGPIELQLNWTTDEIAHTARSCNGCGACRSQLSNVRMCPIFRMAPSEEASPRAKANLVRGILTGQLDADTIASDDFKAVADLCVNCHQCRMECPAEVDIPKLMIEAKAAYVGVNGLRPTDWLLSRLELVSAIGCRFHHLANWALGSRTMRWMIEKTIGIAQGRKLPRFAKQSFLHRADKEHRTIASRGEGRRVLYFVDLYANYHDTALAEAFVTLLEHNGISVYVHPNQEPSGMAAISMGALGRARLTATRNVELLADAVRKGYEIVTTEPAAASCLKHEYPNLLDEDDARLVADHTSEACTYLWRLHQEGSLRLDFKPIHASVAYHQPCHVRSLEVGVPGQNLLQLIPGMAVTCIDKGCSGMAGTYGLLRKNYRSSLRAGLNVMSAMREPQFEAGATECSTCKIQMEQGTTKPTVHPVKILALAYGLTPEAQNPLLAKGHPLVVSNPDENLH